MRCKYIVSLILVITYLFYTPIVFGGMEYSVKCQNKDCNYSKNINFGGGMLFGQITGYCVKCGDFVYIQWETGEQEIESSFPVKPVKEPEPICLVWDLGIAEPIGLYKCPKCSQPFIPIKVIENLKYCPKCKQPSLIIEKTGLMYD